MYAYVCACVCLYTPIANHPSTHMVKIQSYDADIFNSAVTTFPSLQCWGDTGQLAKQLAVHCLHDIAVNSSLCEMLDILGKMMHSVGYH